MSTRLALRFSPLPTHTSVSTGHTPSGSSVAIRRAVRRPSRTGRPTHPTVLLSKLSEVLNYRSSTVYYLLDWGPLCLSVRGRPAQATSLPRNSSLVSLPQILGFLRSDPEYPFVFSFGPLFYSGLAPILLTPTKIV